MISKDILSIVDELIPAYKEIIRGEYAIALAGAHAKGKADIHSDLDIFVYAQDVSPFESRKAIFERICDSKKDFWISEDIVSLPWGGSIDFIYKGYKVETTIRSINKLEEVIDECLNGKIKIYPEAWTLNGYFNYIYLSEIDFIKTIDDSFNIISNLKEKIKIYPLELKKAIINEFWWKSNLWINNFHYISAINRMDIVYTSRITSNTIQNLVQVLFALNEKYFYGDKKIELQLNGLKFCPKSLTDNIELLLTTSRDIEFLQRQRNILIKIADEIGVEVNKI